VRWSPAPALVLAAVAATGAAGGPAATSPSLPSLESALLAQAAGLSPDALHAALASWRSLSSAGEIQCPVLSVIDYELPSTAKRLWVFDLENGRVLFNELVAHGQGSGDDIAQWFSNDAGSRMSSLGTFVTGEAYDGKNGYSLRLRGVEPDVNDHAEARAIVLHGAWYVDEDFAREHGRLGRSWGCPAVRTAVARTLIDEIKDGSVLYAWHPSMGPR
jgi:hypothetical protein